MLLVLLSNIVNIVVLITRSLIILYLTTIVTMIDNIIIDIHGSIGQCCLSYCRTLLNIVVLTTRGLIILYLTTIVTMVDNNFMIFD